MLCKSCGHDIASSEKHCPFCGNVTGFPSGMNGNTPLSAVLDAERIVEGVAELSVRAKVPAARDYDGDEVRVFETAPPKSANINAQETIVFDAITDVKAVSQETVVFDAVSANNIHNAQADYDDYNDGYVLSAGGEYEDDAAAGAAIASRYANAENNNYGADRNRTGKGALPLSNKQIATVAAIAGLAIVLIVVIVLLVKCGSGNDDESHDGVDSSFVFSRNETSVEASSEVSSETSSLTSNEVLSFTSSQTPSRRPESTDSSQTGSESTGSSQTGSESTGDGGQGQQPTE